MNRRLSWALLAGATVLGLLALVVAARKDRTVSSNGRAPEIAGEAAAESGDTEQVRVQLYFVGAQGRLVREPRDLTWSNDPSAFAERIVEGLLEGPRAEAAYRPFPPDVEVGEVHVDADGTAYVDLRSQAHPRPPFAGSRAEMLALYSLVNSVVENVEGARSLVVLWNGRQPRTFGGHIDTSRPLYPARNLETS